MTATLTPTAAVNRARDSWNAGNLEAYLKLYAPHAVLHGYEGVEPGLEGIRAFYQAFWTAFADMRLDFQELLETENRVACRFVLSGRHNGSFNGIPATGRRFSISGITILHMTDGQCVERWSQADFLSLFQQLGALPG